MELAELHCRRVLFMPNVFYIGALKGFMEGDKM